METDSSNRSGLSGPEVARMLVGASEWLRKNADAINEMNVFPVPDGDTGTNMFLTMQSALEMVSMPAHWNAAEVLKEIAHGALMGARGNSGVILSQYLRGVAEGVDGCDTLHGSDLARALDSASRRARAAIDPPVEGTIVTVAGAVAAAVAGSEAGIIDVLATAVSAAAKAVASTPDLLPVLKDAGVLDSGAQGLFILLDGSLRALRNEELPAAPTLQQSIDAGWLAEVTSAHQRDHPFGYCVEFLLSGKDLDAEFLRTGMKDFGDSLLVVGDTELLHLHVHTLNPGAPLTFCAPLGALHKIKIDNMQTQHTELVNQTRDTHVTRNREGVATVAMCSGAGQAKILRGLGAEAILETGGQNPSTAEIIEAIREVGGRTSVVLPNDKDTFPAARLAATMVQGNVWVAPTTSFPQVVAGFLAVQPELSLVRNQAAIEQALQRVSTVEVTTAIRDAVLEGVTVRRGMALALVDGNLAAADDCLDDCVTAAVKKANRSDAELVTIYWGNGATDADARRIGRLAVDACKSAELEVAFGGQRHYDYIIAIE